MPMPSRWALQGAVTVLGLRVSDLEGFRGCRRKGINQSFAENAAMCLVGLSIVGRP